MDDLGFEATALSPAHGGDDELGLPKTTVSKIISELLPADIVCTKETKDLMADCCVEFIHLIATEANDICDKSTKKTITAQIVVEALKNLQFDEYTRELEAEGAQYKQKSKDKISAKKSRFAAMSAMSEEDLVRQQEELFKASRARFEAAQQAAAVVAASANTTSSATGAMLPLVAPLQASSSSTSVAPDALVAPMFPTVAADVDLEEGDDNVDDVDALQRALDDDL